MEIGLCHIEALLKKVHVTSGAEDAFRGKTEAARPLRICLGRDGCFGDGLYPLTDASRL